MAQISEMSLKIKTKCSVTFSIILKSPLRCGLLLLQRASKQSTGPQSWLGMSGSPCPATSDWPKGSQLCDFVWSFRTGSALHWVSELWNSGRVPFQSPLKFLWELLLCLSVGSPFLFRQKLGGLSLFYPHHLMQGLEHEAPPVSVGWR